MVTKGKNPRPGKARLFWQPQLGPKVVQVSVLAPRPQARPAQTVDEDDVDSAVPRLGRMQHRETQWVIPAVLRALPLVLGRARAPSKVRDVAPGRRPSLRGEAFLATRDFERGGAASPSCVDGRKAGTHMRRGDVIGRSSIWFIRRNLSSLLCFPSSPLTAQNAVTSVKSINLRRTECANKQGDVCHQSTILTCDECYYAKNGSIQSAKQARKARRRDRWIGKETAGALPARSQKKWMKSWLPLTPPSA